MVSIAGVLTEAWLLFLLSLIASVLVFPFLFVFSFAYSWLARKYPRTPSILFMALSTFLAILAALVLLEVYLSYTLGKVVAVLRPPAA